MSNNNVLPSIRRVQKRFGGLRTLSDMSLEIREGEIHSLIGPDGIGKTTFFNTIADLYTPDAGKFALGSTPYQPTAVHEAAEASIARAFQNIRPFGDMTVVEDVMVNRRVCTRAGLIGVMFRTRVVRGEEQSIEDWVHDLSDYVDVGKYANYTTHNLSYGHQRRLEIVRVLATQPRPLILDEPATGMNATKKMKLRDLLDKIRSDGETILLIEHDVRLVMDLCNHLTVLDYDKATAQSLPHEMRDGPAVIETYLGASTH